MKESVRTRIKIAARVCLVLGLSVAECWAVRPYLPVQPDPFLEPWRWRSFPELRGLGLRCMAEDREGNMWFGVDEGAVRYDGVKWTTFTPEDGLLSAPVNVFCTTREGSVYAGTEMGICRFHQGSWRRVFPPEEHMPWPTYSLLEAADSSIWAGTVWGALHLGAEQPTLYSSKDMGDALKVIVPRLRLSIVPDGIIQHAGWEDGIGVRVASRDGVGRRFEYGPWIILKLAPGGPGEAAGLRVGDRILRIDGIQPTAPSAALAGKPGTHVTLTVQRKDVPSTFDVAITRMAFGLEGTPGQGTFGRFSAYSICEDREGSLWFGLDWGGIVRYNILGIQPESVSEWRLYTEEDGLDLGYRPRIFQSRDGMIWACSQDSRRGLNWFDGQTWQYIRLRRALGGSNINSSIAETRDGTLWVGGNIGYSYALTDGEWRVYRSTEVLLLPSSRNRFLETRDGALWIAGWGQEAVRLEYGTGQWTTYEGLNFECETPDGAQWFLSADNGVVCADGNVWCRFGVEDGLMDAPSRLIVTRDGVLWAAGSHHSTAATARFDGERWSLQMHARLSWGIYPKAVYESPDGALWFGAYQNHFRDRGQLGGVLRFGQSAGPEKTKAWTHYIPPETPYYVYCLGQTADGIVWVGGNSLRCFDGQIWRGIKEPEELTVTFSSVVYPTPEGDLWIGSLVYGLFRYDGRNWVRYSVRNGLADGSIMGILRGDDGNLWVKTEKGVSCFDGQTWVTQAFPPDLPLSRDAPLRQSRDGAFWINHFSDDWSQRARLGDTTHAEASSSLRTIRYELNKDPPETRISLALERVAQTGDIILGWTGVDPWHAASNEQLQYAWCLDKGKWSPFSSNENKTFASLPSGEHCFEVKARDPHLNEDPTPAVARFTVIPPVWQQPWFIGMMVVFLSIVGFQTSRIVTRTHERNLARETLLAEAEEELQTAHDMQMGLMPEEPPGIEGFDIAGRCIPANHVGGDFFQYFHQEGKLAMAMADVTGHAMAAAVPVMVFSGILDSQIEIGGDLEDLFSRLNRSLYRNLDRQTFVCFTMAQLDPPTCVFSLCDAGCPYPYHFLAETGEIIELQVDTYPLGVRPETDYEMLQTQLQPGDRIVFCSDGIIEADNAEGEQFGFEQTAETIRNACKEGLSAEATIDRILEAVAAFKGDAPQSDDMTCVVVRVEG